MWSCQLLSSSDVTLPFSRSTLNTIQFQKSVFFSHKLACVGLRFGKNQGLWRHFGDTISPCLGGVLQLVKKMALRTLCHSSRASVCGSFARHPWASSGLFQAWQRLMQFLRLFSSIVSAPLAWTPPICYNQKSERRLRDDAQVSARWHRFIDVEKVI